MNWYIGQRVIAITNHPDGGLVKNKEYIIKGLKSTSCCGILIDVGISNDEWIIACHHNKKVSGPGEPWFFYEKRFAPIEDIKSDYTIESLIKEVDSQVAVLDY